MNPGRKPIAWAIAGLLIAAVEPAIAEEWVKVAATANFTEYLARDALKRSRNLSEVLVLRDFNAPARTESGTFWSATFLEEYDCDNRLSRIKGVIAYAQKGGTGSEIYRSDRVTQWMSVGGDTSIGMFKWKIACNPK